MTETTKREPLYQVWATETATGQYVAVPYFPRMCKEAVEQFAATMRMLISTGKLKTYSDPQVVLHVPNF